MKYMLLQTDKFADGTSLIPVRATPRWGRSPCGARKPGVLVAAGVDTVIAQLEDGHGMNQFLRQQV